ncbi:MAG: hypothetical protein J0M34_02915 [Alphaproteobacteria bacterium]|nr:hypothetical protein [Alphaproteobacteria bacterium]
MSAEKTPLNQETAERVLTNVEVTVNADGSFRITTDAPVDLTFLTPCNTESQQLSSNLTAEGAIGFTANIDGEEVGIALPSGSRMTTSSGPGCP